MRTSKGSSPELWTTIPAATTLSFSETVPLASSTPVAEWTSNPPEISVLPVSVIENGTSPRTTFGPCTTSWAEAGPAQVVSRPRVRTRRLFEVGRMIGFGRQGSGRGDGP